MQRQLTAFAFIIALLAPAAASADMLGFYARGHGSYLLGADDKLSYFNNGNGGGGYGFQVGAEVVQIDLFLDANFHPGGSQWNQLGIGWDMDFMPGPIFLEPAAQLTYFFGKQVEEEGVKGLFPRIGGRAGVKFAKVVMVGVEAFGGYAISLPDPQAGLVFMGAGFIGIDFSVF